MKEAIKEGTEIPEEIAYAPEVNIGLELYFNGFLELLNSRQIGMGLGPISWSVIQEYCMINNLDEDQTEEMHYYIRELDTVYLEHSRKKSKT